MDEHNDFSIQITIHPNDLGKDTYSIKLYLCFKVANGWVTSIGSL